MGTGPGEPIDDATFEWLDVESLQEAVLAEVRYSVWTATGGSDGCAQCKARTFRQRIDVGHYECARELAVKQGADGVLEGLKCGGLSARLWRWLYPTHKRVA